MARFPSVRREFGPADGDREAFDDFARETVIVRVRIWSRRPAGCRVEPVIGLPWVPEAPLNEQGAVVIRLKEIGHSVLDPRAPVGRTEAHAAGA